LAPRRNSMGWQDATRASGRRPSHAACPPPQLPARQRPGAAAGLRCATRPAYHDAVLSRTLVRARPHRPPLAGLAVAVASLTLATALAGLAHLQFGVSHAAVVYLLAVVAVGMGYGSWLAIGTSVASFLLYDFFFVQPLYTFSIAAP
jgi:hypothetical protein